MYIHAMQRTFLRNIFSPLGKQRSRTTSMSKGPKELKDVPIYTFNKVWEFEEGRIEPLSEEVLTKHKEEYIRNYDKIVKEREEFRKTFKYPDWYPEWKQKKLAWLRDNASK